MHCFHYVNHIKNKAKLVAPYSFVNSVHKSAAISYNGKVMSSKSTSKDSYSLEFKGLYQIKDVKQVLKILVEKLQKDKDKNTLKLSFKTLRNSESLNWVVKQRSSIKRIEAVIQEDDVKYYVDYN